MNIRPTWNRVVLVLDSVEEKTAGGIIIPSESQKAATTGTVVVCADNEFNEELNKGDRVLFGKYAGTPIKVQNEDFIIMNVNEILAVIEN